MRHTANGLTYQEIAKEMGVSVETVKSFRRRVLQRLEAKNTSHALALLMMGGWVTEDDVGFFEDPMPGR
jgi:DNA-binding CsgD family transcriptional regulator